ncbi:MAG: PorV/PorQ family protein [Microscillaceae bacterium]|nr:PorV/PorQ family protein [Microscillaceae bacterium]MDW8460418.1 PorV/PorQ family protein [Cytophagales bacterium]
MHKKVALFVLILFPYLLFSQTPKYSNEFMNLGAGARALGMGNSQVAVVQDVTASYWNPAGLVNLKTKYEASLMHAAYFAGIANYDYAGFALKIDTLSALGISGIRFGVDDIPDTRFLYDADGRLNYQNVRYFSASDYGFLVSYARKATFLEGLRWGGSLKIIYRKAGDFATAWGFGLDAGAIYQAKGWRFAAMARDVTTTFNMWAFNVSALANTFLQTGNELPSSSTEITLPRLIIGTAKNFELNDKIHLLASLDLVNTFDGYRNEAIKTHIFSIAPQVGLEASYKQIVCLRAGVNNIQQRLNDTNFNQKTITAQANFGLGIRLNNFVIDYALAQMNLQQQATYSHFFSLKLSFD